MAPSSPNVAPNADRLWTAEYMEVLISWMEENRNRIAGRPNNWASEAKQEAFPTNEIITEKRVKDKINNMRTQFRKTQQVQEQRGFGLGQVLDERSLRGEYKPLHDVPNIRPSANLDRTSGTAMPLFLPPGADMGHAAERRARAQY